MLEIPDSETVQMEIQCAFYQQLVRKVNDPDDSIKAACSWLLNSNPKLEERYLNHTVVINGERQNPIQQYQSKCKVLLGEIGKNTDLQKVLSKSQAFAAATATWDKRKPKREWLSKSEFCSICSSRFKIDCWLSHRLIS